jgi:two-component system, OmpR family, phosphate regulon sensor histidine kinase PhoR
LAKSGSKLFKALDINSPPKSEPGWLDQKYPPSVLVGLVTAFAITVIFVGVRLAVGPVDISLLWETIAMLVLSFAALTLVLVLFLYRRLKQLDAEHTKQVQDEIHRLKQMELYRREFLGDVSHELKTPIFAIEGFIETLLDGALEDPKVNRKFLQKAGKHAERLSNLVSDILVISHIESGQLSMVVEKFCMYDLMVDLVDSLSYKFTRKGRDIHYEIHANGLERAMVLADKQRIEQVLRNLIDNAVKYGNTKGNIVLMLAPHTEGKLVVKVKDDGPGIDTQHQARLFERFYRIDKSRSRNSGGTGLGLAICKHFIEAHKERIWVESTPGFGATFMFSLSRVS